MITSLLTLLRSGKLRLAPVLLTEGEIFLLNRMARAGKDHGVAFPERQMPKDLDRLVQKGLAERIGPCCTITDTGLSRLRSNMPNPVDLR
jgi:hypothetical protein